MRRGEGRGPARRTRWLDALLARGTFGHRVGVVIITAFFVWGLWTDRGPVLGILGLGFYGFVLVLPAFEACRGRRGRRAAAGAEPAAPQPSRRPA